MDELLRKMPMYQVCSDFQQKTLGPADFSCQKFSGLIHLVIHKKETKTAQITRSCIVSLPLSKINLENGLMKLSSSFLYFFL